MNINMLIPGANYYEIYVINGINEKNKLTLDTCNSFTIGLNKKIFYQILSKIDSQKFKFFQREHKEYQHKDMACQCFINDETKVFRSTPINISEQKNFIIIASNRTKLTLINFPSTKNLQKITYIKKLIFRITNRIYLNFEISVETTDPKEKIYTIYINYNHEDNVDFNMISKTINEIILLITL